MSQIKISQLPEYTGSTTGVYLVMDNASQTATYKVTRENIIGASGTSGTSGTSGSSGVAGNNGSSGTSGQNGSSGTSGVGASGSSGTSGTSGGTGSSGTSGQNGSSGTSGTSGSNGSSGTSGDSLFAQTGSFWATTNDLQITGSLTVSGSNQYLSGSSFALSGAVSQIQSVSINGTSSIVNISSANRGIGLYSDGTYNGLIDYSNFLPQPFFTIPSNSGFSNPPVTISRLLRLSNGLTVTSSLTAGGDIYDISSNTTVQPSTYLTSSLSGQVNIIKGWGDNPAPGGAAATQANYTGSLRITGSNNIVSLPQIKASGFSLGSDLSGYISGSDNMILSNNAGIFLNTGSAIFPKIQNNSLVGSTYISMNFTTSSLAGGHPIVSNNTLYGGTIQINSNSGSIQTMATNIINGGTFSSTQNFVTNTRPTITGNILGGVLALNHISSSINYQTNWVNSPLTINNHLSSSAIALNSLTFTNNTVLGGGGNTTHTIYVSGSQSTNATRTISSNLIGGSNITVSSSFVSSSNSNLVSTLIYGNNLHVSASHTVSTNGGSAFFGRFNMTGSNLEDAQSVVFAVGTGTGTAARRTGFLIDSGSNVIISGSLNVTGSARITTLMNLAAQNPLPSGLLGDLAVSSSNNLYFNNGSSWVLVV